MHLLLEQNRNSSVETIAFRVAAPGKRDAFGLAEELDDISEVMRKVVDHGYSVRAKNREGDRHGSYKVGGRGIEGWAREEQ
ncbi:hypothetical protein D9M72_624360 [compost metagenome]